MKQISERLDLIDRLAEKAEHALGDNRYDAQRDLHTVLLDLRRDVDRDLVTLGDKTYETPKQLLARCCAIVLEFHGPTSPAYYELRRLKVRD